jgi:HSP20 family molecular chaperone IbpA
MLTLRTGGALDNCTFLRPSSLFSELFDDIDELLLNTPFNIHTTAKADLDSPDIIKTDNGMEVYIELPGTKKKDLNVTIENKRLTVSAEKSIGSRKSSFKRSWTIPPVYDVETLQATLADGVLKLVLEKRPEAKEKKIEVKIK